MEETTPKKITLSGIARWGVGILLLLASLGSIIGGDYLAGLFLILAVIVLIPPFAQRVEKKFNFSMSGVVRFLLVFGLLLGFSATATSYAPTNNTDAIKAQETIVPTEAASITNQKTPLETTVEKPVETTVEKPVETSAETQYHDVEWLQLVTTDSSLLASDLNLISTTANNLDYDKLLYAGSRLSVDSSAALEESKKYQVSPQLQTAKREYELGLSDLNKAGEYTVSGVKKATNGDSSGGVTDLVTAGDYLESGGSYIKKSASLLNEFSNRNT